MLYSVDSTASQQPASLQLHDIEDIIAVVRNYDDDDDDSTFMDDVTSHVAQSCYSVIGDKPFLWSKPKFDPP